MSDDFDAAALRFGDLWKTAQHLNICEVESVLRAPFSRMQPSNPQPHLDRAYRHALRFSRIRDVQALQQLRVALEDWEPPSSLGSLVTDESMRLVPFEVAQLVNLMPADAEEAKAVLPSLERFPAGDVLSLLEIMGSYAKLQIHAQISEF